MNKIKKYVVIVEKSYIDLFFEFERINEASVFIDMILTSYAKDEEGKKGNLKVSIEVVTEQDGEEKESEDK